MSDLQPPPRININTQDVAGTQDLSESDDHFSSASEGEAPPTPITRVERVDDRPAHGEVPGTHAYSLRTQDAVPDEVEIVPEGQRSRSGTQSRSRATSNLSASSRPETPRSPGGTPVPRTVVERVDDKPAHGEVPGTYAAEQRRADAEPDEVRRATHEARSGVINEDDQAVDDNDSRQAWFRSMWEGDKEQPPEADADAENDDDFGDDFDEFNEGGGEDDDFGDFDEAGEATPMAEEPKAQFPTTPLPDALAGLPPLNLSNLSATETQQAIAPYINTIFPNSTPLTPLHDLPSIDPSKTSPFLSDRSLSLWQQLVSPPPMQPPNWTRSRIRRLFLVSLGVPVDLDEILPPSKQKRLVLPNINLPTTASPRHSTSNPLDRLKDQGNNSSTTSLDSKTGQPKRPSKRVGVKGPPPPPDFDTNAASLLCSTTVEAMSVYADAELKQHVMTLEVLNKEASKVLEYWLQRKDEGVREKEALEGVIENLVGFVKGRRGGGK